MVDMNRHGITTVLEELTTQTCRYKYEDGRVVPCPRVFGFYTIMSFRYT